MCLFLLPLEADVLLWNGLVVLQIQYFAEPGDTPFRMLGEVQNESPRLMADLQVELTLYNAAGEAVVTQPGLVARRVLAPGSRSPFEIVLHQVPPPWGRYSVRVAARAIGQEVLDVYPEIVVIQHTAEDLGNGVYRVTGEVENRSDFDAAQVEVVCTLYAGDDEEIVALAITDTDPQEIAQGARAVFSVDAVPPSGVEVVGYRLFAQGARAER